ncbi:hypothetical protein CONPUDRAFT_168878 [Coniophora puteana RWD-64-598 SS2]|uniref:F-box domain-containing protein n=1 Tax=Coniophora puteana (strain RWD-64-598) TaxID=741705 RepID=A0A5M3MB52_CONPW|nr:uncharacterized protein CONPUDRAFT_168878 [Coniophora puteana RWD-64-598 SS2]EIW76313.1 hypothetical protein CONPUDRAFT_168878 [Coniophora puteana RWD-64-598 SS2]
MEASTADDDSYLVVIPPIMSLPTEILLRIIELASQWSTMGFFNGWPEYVEYTGPSADKLAFVCRRWLDVLAMKPVFWKSLHVALDGATFVPNIIETFFAASGDNQLEITITSGDSASCILTPSQECERLDFVMKHMAPHFGRMSEISIEVFYRSTIVHISSYFNNRTMSHLSDLNLVSYDTNDVSPLRISTLETPSLSQLKTDAGSFMNLMNGGIAWQAGRRLSGLCVTKYRPASHLAVINSRRFLEGLKAMAKLMAGVPDVWIEVEDVALDGEDITTFTMERLEGLRLSDIRGNVASAICNSITSSTVAYAWITRCEPISRCTVPGFELEVKGISSSLSLLRLLQDWQGWELAITNCGGFDDWVLGALAVSSMRNGRTCPQLRTLKIIGGTFSVAALQRMCEMRLDDEEGRIQRLMVEGGPELKEDLRKWFEDNTEHFSWRDICP